MFLNSVISTPGARFANLDIKNFYLGTDMPEPEYIKMPVDMIQPQIMKHYNLYDKTHNGYIYARVQKGMYGPPQAGILANKQLQQNLLPYGYSPVHYTPSLWKHKKRDTSFVLIVDNFGVKITSKQNALHLINAIKDNYEDKEVNWKGDKFCGFIIDWDYNNKLVDIY